MKSKFMIPLQFFAEPPADPTPSTDPPNSDPAPAVPPANPAPVNYDELVGRDAAFRSWLDGRITAATNTAVTNAQTKWQKAQDANLSEAEKLKSMTADEKAAYYEKKWQDEVSARAQAANAASLEKQAAAMLTEASIPADFIGMFNFATATAEQVKERVAQLSGYEYHKKGEFEKAVTAAVNERLKQNPPETHKGDAGATDLHGALAARYGK